MKCEICKEEEATHTLNGIKCCRECMYEEVKDNLREEAIEYYISEISRKL